MCSDDCRTAWLRKAAQARKGDRRKTCPVCGTENPTGIDAEVLWMLGAAATLLPIGLYLLFKTVLRHMF